MATLTTARAKVRSGLATASFFAALIGGCLAAVSTLGGPFKTLATAGPWYMPWVWFVIFVVVCAGDWAEDAIPNRRAVYTAVAWPSFLVAALTGESGQKLFSAVDAVSGILGEKWGTTWAKAVNDFLTISSDLRNAFTVFSLLGIGMGVVWAHQYAKKRKKAKGAAGAKKGDA